MTFWNVFNSHVLYLVGLGVVSSAFAQCTKHRLTASLPMLALIFALLWMAYTAVFLLLVAFLPPNEILRSEPTKDWQTRAEKAQVAVVLGFGYEEDKCGNMEPGLANVELLDWTIANTGAMTIFVQEGVWVAACDSCERECVQADRQIKRMHEHCRKVYLNTFETAFCALQEMEKLDAREVVLVAHDLQLERAAWDFEAVKQAREECRDFTFIIPEMPAVSFVENSVHRHTRNEKVWRLVELLVSRPRDFFSPMPSECKTPLP